MNLLEEAIFIVKECTKGESVLGALSRKSFQENQKKESSAIISQTLVLR